MSLRLPRARALLKQLLAAAILGGLGFFFWRALRQNWEQIATHDFRLSYPFLLVAFGTAVGSALLATYTWHLTLRGLSGRGDMTFGHSFATVNSTALTKYLPGKFWSYALQMYWLSRLNYSKTLVLCVNLTNLAVSLLMGVTLAVGFLLPSGRFPLPLLVAVFAVLLLTAIVSIRYYGVVVRIVTLVVRRLLKRELSMVDVPTPLLVRINVLHFLSQLISGVGGYVLCHAIGYDLQPATILLVMASLILSDAAGFVFFIVPGGLGVRETTMYFLLRGAPAGSLALVFPLVSRVLYMMADLLLGVVALLLLRRSAAGDRVATTLESNS